MNTSPSDTKTTPSQSKSVMPFRESQMSSQFYTQKLMPFPTIAQTSNHFNAKTVSFGHQLVPSNSCFSTSQALNIQEKYRQPLINIGEAAPNQFHISKEHPAQKAPGMVTFLRKT